MTRTSDGSWSARRRGTHAVVAATALAVLGLLPVFLIGPSAALIQEDLGVEEARLGAVVAAYFATAAMCAVPVGRTLDQMSIRRMMLLGSMGSCAILALISGSWSWPVLLLALSLGGLVNAVTQLGGNLQLAGAVSPHRQGLAFGVKGAAPLAVTLAGGVAVPAIALDLGWRSVFVIAAVVALVTGLVLLRTAPDQAPPRRPVGAVRATFPRRPLVVLGAASACATGAAVATTTFLAPYAVSVGVEPGAAGILTAIGSAGGFLTRVLLGWRADYRGGGHLLVVSCMLVVGAAAVAVLPVFTSVPALLVLTLMAYTLAWGWPGLFQLTIVRGNPQAPAAAGGVTHVGTAIGGVVGPLGFGVMVSAVGWTLAWSCAAAWLFSSAVLMLFGRRLARRAWRQPMLVPRSPEGPAAPGQPAA